jgi:hypothetical protein
VDPDLDPAIFVNDLQDGKKNYFFCLLLFEAKCTIFFKDKVTKRHKTGFQGFPYDFCLLIEGSGAGPVLRANGSGWSKNIRIIPIRNTDYNLGQV